MTDFAISIGLMEGDPEDPLLSYPDIPEGERDRLDWQVYGDISVTVDGDALLTPITQDGVVTEYLWRHLHGLHNRVEDLLAGDTVELSFYDDDGEIVIVPENGAVIYRCEREGTNGDSREARIPLSEFGTELVRVTDELREALVTMNGALASSELVQEMRDSRERTVGLLTKNGVAIDGGGV